MPEAREPDVHPPLEVWAQCPACGRLWPLAEAPAPACVQCGASLACAQCGGVATHNVRPYRDEPHRPSGHGLRPCDHAHAGSRAAPGAPPRTAPVAAPPPARRPAKRIPVLWRRGPMVLTTARDGAPVGVAGFGLRPAGLIEALPGLSASLRVHAPSIFGRAPSARGPRFPS